MEKNMPIAKVLQDVLGDSMKQKPLGPGELRRVPGILDHYFALEPRHQEREHLFSGHVDGLMVFIFQVTPDGGDGVTM